MFNEYSLGKRLLALFLSAVLILGMVPVNQASAAENEEIAVFSFETAAPESIQYTEGLTYANAASGGEGNGAITYTITAGTEVAEIDNATGILTILSAGTVTVRAVKAADGEVQEQIAEYTLQIVQPEKKAFAFAVAEPENLAYMEELTYTNAASGGEGNGTVTYALLVLEEVEPDPENPEETPEPKIVETDKMDIASIDKETGELTILKAGTVTVRATKAEDGEIPAQVVEYSLQIDLGEQTNFAFAVAEDVFGYSATEKYLNEAAGGESTGAITYVITTGSEFAEIDAETGEVTTLMPGTISVTATKAADEKYKEATATYTLLIAKGIQTGFGFAVAAPAAVVYADELTYPNAASGGESTGEITYAITTGEDVATVDADGVLTILKHGAVTVTATKAGDDKYNEVTAEYTLEVTKVPQTGFTFEVVTPDALEYAENLTFTNKASGGEGIGEITYAVTDGTDVATIDADGVLTILKHGTVTVTATKAEDDIYAETKAVYTLTINGWQQDALVFDNAEPEMLAYEYEGMTYTNAATGGSGMGALTYAITEGSNIAKVDANGTLTIRGMGTITVVATKAADNAYYETTATYMLKVGVPQEPIRFEDENPTITYSDGATYQQEPVGGSGEGAITYEILSGWNVATLNALTGELSIKESGEIVVKAVKAADGKYAATKATYTLSVEKAEQTGFGFAEEQATITYNDNENLYKLEATGGESTSTKITYEIVTGNDVAELTAAGNELHILKSGTVVVKATKSGDSRYKDVTVQFTLIVEQATQTISFANTEIKETYGIASYSNAVIVSDLCSTIDPVYEIVGDNTIGATINKETGELTFGDSVEKVGTITVKVTKGADDCYKECSAQYTFTLEYAERPDVAYMLSGDKKNENGWYTDDVTITAPEGYLISCHNLLSTVDWTETIVCGTEGENREFTVYLKNIETGRITDGIVVEGLKIDKTKPISLAIEYKTAAWYEILESIFGFSKDTVEVFFSANDLVSGIGVVEYSVDGGATFTVLEKTLDTYSTSIPAQYRDQVVLRVTDIAGNVITTLEDEDTDNNDRTLVVDDIAPVIDTVFSGKYVYNEEDNIYYAGSDAFAITFTVTDANYDLREANPVVKVNDVVQELAWSSAAESGKAVLVLPNEGHYTITADFTDRSGNVAEQFNKVVYVDKTAPVRTVTFTDPSRIVDLATMQDKDGKNFDEGDAIVAYYGADEVVTATIEIIEENFRPEDVVITVNDEPVAVAEWENESGSWKNTVTLTAEGDYVIGVTYKDRAQNEMAAYQSQRIVIDKTAPVISVVYENEDVKNTIDGLDYFDEKQTATITIQEHNFRADDVRIRVSSKDAVDADVLTLNADGFVEAFASQGVDRDAWTPYVEGTWRSENDTYELTLVFAEDANYTFDVEYTDLAAHQADDYEQDAFTVDKTAPVNLTITFSESVLEETPDDGITYLYYDDQVTVTVTAEDTTSGVHYFDYSYVNAEGVSGVNAQLLNQRVEAARNGTKGAATFQIPKEKLTEFNQFNGTVIFAAADRSEKKNDLTDVKRIVVDNIKPTLKATYNKPVQTVGGIDYYAGNISGTIEITEANFFAEMVDVTVTKDGEKYDAKVTWNDNSVDTHVGTFEFTEDGHYIVNVAYTDKSGNVMEEYTSQELVLDATAPVDVNISYEEYGEGESYYPNKFEEMIDKLFNVFYYNAAAKVTITATDVTSGMEGVALNVTKKGSEGATTIDLPENLVIGSNGKITGNKGAIKDIDVQYENGKMIVTCRIPEQFRGMLDIVAVDMAKNETPYSDTTIVVVDTIAPDRTVTFAPDRMVDIATMKDVESCVEGDKVVLYFNKDAVATFEITEANFFADGINVQVNGQSVDITDWTNVENDTWRGTLTLTEEGDYVITASYLDRARNQMIPYESQRIVVDKTAPVITTKYSNTDVKNTIDGRDYLAAQQTVTITVKEHNFRADDVKVIVSGTNAAGSDVLKNATYEATGKDRTAWTAYKEGTWRNDDDIYELTLTFDADANYTFDVEYEDLATNQAADYAADAFTVDKTAPAGLSISYSESVLETILDAITFGFYNERVTVTINAADETSGIHYFVYSYLNAPGVSSVNAELSNQKIQVSGSNGAGAATFMIPKDVLRNNNQFNGTVNFTAYDRSENSSDLADKKRIVVDNISPNATVKYNASVQTIEDITYYDDEITCTIEIDEANFYSEDVKATVTKDGKEFDVKVAWTKDSADRNTGTFTLEQDGEYTISIEYTDKSGNKMVNYVSEKHTLDTTHPTVKVSNIKANSANKDEEYGFVIDIYDINLDVESMKPVLTAVVKDENGIYTVKEIELGDPTEVDVEEGTRYAFTVDNLPEDALYKLTCTVMDLAENETIEMLLEDGEAYEEVAFSINRNGSTFAYGNEFTEKLVEQYYVYSVNEDVVIVEVNVDPIENYVIKLNGDELTEGKDYTTTQTSNEGEWSRRVYYIDKDLFVDEGEYNVIVSTVDKAETTAFSDVKNLTVAFVVDQTKPVVTITGLEAGGRYQTDEQTVTLIPTDEGGRLKSLCVVVFNSDGNPLTNELGEDISVRFEMSGDEFLKYLEENDGKVIFTVPEGLDNQVQIVCNDCAVNANNQTNEYNELFERVTVSQNKLVIFYANKPLFYGSIAGVLGVILLLIFILIKRKKKAENQ